MCATPQPVTPVCLTLNRLCFVTPVDESQWPTMEIWLMPNACEISWKGKVLFIRQTVDTEVVPHLIARSGPPIEQAIPDALRVVEGAYAMLFMTETQLVAAQDPRAFHPLALGKLDDGWVVASETCAPGCMWSRICAGN